ncbi:TOG array regulator of axonemal microtubules protein 2-like [Passer domesticus]|uniref:TOG array regulator of axonemal microtubules protein 2-like n=1 Tax=Passer domesticus TaxID=48849 RepID=UPI0030FE435E
MLRTITALSPEDKERVHNKLTLILRPYLQRLQPYSNDARRACIHLPDDWIEWCQDLTIFDYFVLRISDSHKKVKQKALDVLAEIIGLLEDALNPVMIPLAQGITKNLNSKDPGVHAAAVNALEESIAHLVLVEWVHARRPAVVQRCALPVLWSCLENKALPVRSASVRTVLTKLACALCQVMGTQLRKCAASKPPHVRENLNSLLGW